MDRLAGKGIRLYNLFPRLAGSMPGWRQHLPRIKQLGMNAVYLNPFHYPGFSGSLYSVKDYYKFNPDFVDTNSGLSPNDQLKVFLDACHDQGLLVIMDLVINHTAFDATILHEHPEWFRHHPDGRVMHPGANHDGRWVEWGDLAEVDNEHSKDRDNLWGFWTNLVVKYLRLGFDGCRCDAAYLVREALWQQLIGRAREASPGCLFLAESLGCSFKQVEQLAKVGFDYLFNSSKWWDFNSPWGVEQQQKIAAVVPTISFPESHDTDRLAAEYQGDIARIKRQLLFSATYSKGVMIPIGFEFGFRRKLDVVTTRPEWWETDTCIDLVGFIQKVMNLKDRSPILNTEVPIRIVDQDNWCNVFCYLRQKPGMPRLLTILNKSHRDYHRVFMPDLVGILGGPPLDVSPDFVMDVVPERNFEYHLQPSQVKLFTTRS
jgi:starch synthase (maltosyl-transferring)